MTLAMLTRPMRATRGLQTLTGSPPKAYATSATSPSPLSSLTAGRQSRCWIYADVRDYMMTSCTLFKGTPYAILYSAHLRADSYPILKRKVPDPHWPVEIGKPYKENLLSRALGTKQPISDLSMQQPAALCFVLTCAPDDVIEIEGLQHANIGADQENGIPLNEASQNPLRNRESAREH